MSVMRFEEWYAEYEEKNPGPITRGDVEAGFAAGWAIAKNEMSSPTNSAEPPSIQHLLNRDQRDALCAANAFLTILQSTNEVKGRIQKIINVISDMLYE